MGWVHPVSMNEMGSSTRRRYLEHYTAEKGYESLMEIYDSVLASCERESTASVAVA